REIAEILFQVGPLLQLLAVNLGNRKTMAPEVTRERQEGDILFPNVVPHANGAALGIAQAEEPALRAAELGAQRTDGFGRSAKLPLEKFFQNVHEKRA